MSTLGLMALSLIFGLAIGLPIAVALGGLGLIWIVALDPNFLNGVAYAVWNSATNEALIAIPLFVLMGEILQRSDIAGRFYQGVATWLRWLPGNLLHANIAASALFAAVSGSSLATAATIGTAAIPRLRKDGYDPGLTYGSLAAGGTLGILIPPSIPLIIYSALTDTSVGQLFIAAVVPGLLMTGIFAGYILIRATLNPSIAPVSRDDTTPQIGRGKALLMMMPLLFIMVVVLSGIYFGWTTTNEAAALGVVLALLVAGRKGLSLPMLRQCSASTVRFTAMIILIITGASIFSFAVFSWGVTRMVAEYISTLAIDPIWILGLIIVVYFILGMFMDAISIMVLTMAVIFPTVTHLGYDPIWFGVVVVILLEIGLITPPVGMNLFTIQSLDPRRISLADVAWGSAPFVVLMLIALMFLIAFPQIALWLPSRM